MTMVTKRISAAHFKAQCLSLMDQVEAQRGEVIITKRGKPVAKLVPIEQAPRSVFGCMAGTAEIVGDLLAPTTSPEDWEANR
jgi:prevent-host-death family protein